ncbi:acyltransferase family protein [Adhaeribacter radiodurans]|uniref:Acyltransferase n=1 Tax=Adhaeribacter radiodurans TaxID=2745197 RepID=A0A7L7L8D5_9BACT|nr:acyltransferase [Adhaeribacter radiodurans]QMU29081.1 acyltransferase [Adhaeribacter radiodurans]
MKYIKQLDSLRALAIFTVIIVHWFPKDSFWYRLSELINAPTIFFTLSGFLITNILLKERKKAEILETNKLTLIKNFLIKRGLRLFPAYFLVLGIYYFFPLITKDIIDFKYFVTFTTNIYIYKIQQWPALAHLWSMSVEEQFYLVWPWIILFTSRKYLLPIIVTSIIVGLNAQYILSKNDFSSVLTLYCLDALAMGALLSWFVVMYPQRLKQAYKISVWLAIASFSLIICYNTFHFFHLVNVQFLVSILTIWTILFFIQRKEDKPYLLRFLLDNKILMALGKISYGLYLYHFLIPYYTYPWFHKLNVLLHFPDFIVNNTYMWIAENFLLLLVVALASYKFIEMPFLQLKKYFEPTRLPQPVSLVVVAKQKDLSSEPVFL